MNSFTYYAPTKVVFGKDTESQAGTLIKEQGASKVLLHYGGQSAVKSGLIERIEGSLVAAGISFVLLGGVVPNPHLALVREGAELCKKEKVDFILAVGGGSVIDSAKAIAYSAASGKDAWDFFEGTLPTAALPIGAVLTIAAAGSEMSDSSVITNEQTGEKRGVSSPFGRCKFAIMNPALTLTLPANQTAYGCADIIMHTLERYFQSGERLELTDNISEALLRTVLINAQKLARKPDSYSARAEIMWAGSLSHNGLTGTGGDWSCHQLAHEISGKYDTPHGAALTVVWPSWARYVYKENPARFAHFATEVLGAPEEGSEEELALMVVDELESFFWGLGLPTSFEELGISPSGEDIAEMVRGCSRNFTRTIGDFKILDEADMAAIYKAAISSSQN